VGVAKKHVRYVVAVSGGVDSVVLLDMLVRVGEHDLTVAHFDHGIRPDSAADARFVEALATKYGLPFITKREELGPGASEELARTERYAFLRNAAKKLDAQIVTAHHADDIVETIAINISRGTGWRGVAVLDTPGIVRPLLYQNKSEIRAYARDKRLEWVEDSTNAQVLYLRNRLRRLVAMNVSVTNKQAILALWKRQVELKGKITQELLPYLNSEGEYSRYFLTHVDPLSAGELLRAAIFARTKISPTRPQIERALLMIKTARAGSVFELGNGVALRFKERTFIVETP
jgi:tRNA(Ile)-lysidine synthase